MSKAGNIQSITSKASIERLSFIFICPVCNKSDSVFIIGPMFYTDNMLTSVRNKSICFTERVCKSCYSIMDVKMMKCVL